MILQQATVLQLEPFRLVVAACNDDAGFNIDEREHVAARGFPACTGHAVVLVLLVVGELLLGANRLLGALAGLLVGVRVIAVDSRELLRVGQA